MVSLTRAVSNYVQFNASTNRTTNKKFIFWYYLVKFP